MGDDATTAGTHPEGRRRVGVLLPRDLPARAVLPFARRAQTLGFDELWVVEDLGYRGGVAQAAAVLATTERLTVGIGILPVGARNAAFAAMDLATLAQLFPGRLVVGVGHGMPGWMRSVGAWPASPLTLLAEHTAALRELLRGRPAPAGGRSVSLEGLTLTEVPEVVPPVLLGVRGPRSLALAGRVADGVVLAEPAHPAYVAAARAQAGLTGRPTAHVVTYDVAAVHDDAAAALTAVRPALQWIGEPDWAPHLAPLPYAADLAALRAGVGSPAEFADALPDAWVADLALAGTPAQVGARIAARHDAGATCVVLTPVGPDPHAALAQLARALPAPPEPAPARPDAETRRP